MAITVNSVGVATGNNGTTSPSCTYLKSTSDELLIVWLASDDAETVSSISDNSTGGSLTWTAARNDLNNAPGATIWWAVSDGVAETITITATTSSGQFVMCAAGISGADTTNPFDATAGAAASNNAPQVSLTTNNDNSLVVLLCAEDDAVGLSWTPGGAPTEAFYKTTGGGNKSGALGGYEIQASAGAQTHYITTAKGDPVGWRMIALEMIEVDATYTETAGQSASEDFTGAGTWPFTDWEEGFGWASGRTSDVNVNDALQPNAANSDHLNRRTDSWDATNQSCTVEWGCGDNYTGGIAPFITAMILSQNDGSFFGAALGSTGAGNFIELYEVTSGNVWTQKGSTYSSVGTINNGCRVRLTYDGTDINVDYYNGTSWTNNVITWTRDVGNTSGTPGICQYSRTSDPSEVSYWEASAGAVTSATVYSIEVDATYTASSGVTIYAVEVDATYTASTAATIYSLEVDATYTGPSATIYSIEVDAYHSAQTNYPSQVSGHRLQDGYGNDMFLIADSPWSLFQRLSDTDRDTYLNDRAARGVNAVLIRSSTVGAEVFGDTAPIDLTDYQDHNGNAPFTSITDWSSPVDAYWDNVAAGVQKCLDLGITVFLTASYCGYNDEQGWQGEMSSQTDQDMTDFGDYLGRKFRKFPNIVWVHSGDHTPNATVKSRLEAIQAAIAARMPWALHTLHCSEAGTGRTDYTTSPSWLDIDSAYSYETAETTWIKTAYDDTPTLPAVYIEGRYEDAASNPSDIQLRRQMWWALVGGMAGTFYAHNECWNFQAAVAFGINGDWQNHYQDPGADFLEYIAGRARADLVPDYANAILTAGQGTLGTTDYALAAKSDDNNVVMAYTPSQKQLTFDLTSMTGTEVNLKWINPATNAETSIGTGITQASGMQYTPPSAGDWVFYAETTTTAATVYAIEVDATYTVGPATVYAIEVDATYSEKSATLYSVEVDATYTGASVTVYSLEVDATYSELTISSPYAFTSDETTQWDESSNVTHYTEVELISSGSDTTYVRTVTANDIDEYGTAAPTNVQTCKHVHVDVRGIIEDAGETAVVAVSLWASAIQQGSTQYISGNDFAAYGTRGTAPTLVWNDLNLTQAQCTALQVRWQALTAAP